MFCVKCGAQLPPDSQFCTVCGTKVENAPVAAQPYVAPIAPMDQAFISGQPPKKKGKALLWVLIGAGVALIAAAVLIFVVFAPGGIAGPFSGNTVQTRFANDVVGVFSGAVSGLEAENDMKKMLDKPFELTMNSAVDMSGVKTDADVAYVYDEKALGINVKTVTDYSASEYAEFFGDEAAMESTIKLLLLEDTLYIDQEGSVTGIKFNSNSDLSKPMPLKDRIAAFFENKELSKIDFLKLTEMFLNSIDESYFDKSATETTLTLDGKALAQTLDTFAEKLEDNDELNDTLSEIIEEISDTPIDVASAIKLAAPMLEESETVLTMTVSYENNRPVGLLIAAEESGSELFYVDFGYENEKDGKSIALEVSASGSNVLSLDFNILKTKDGFDFEGTFSIPGADDITMSGSQTVDGNSVSAEIEMTLAGQTILINTDETVKIGKPSDDVADDPRFDIDTSHANIIDVNDIFSGDLGMGMTDLPSLTD